LLLFWGEKLCKGGRNKGSRSERNRPQNVIGLAVLGVDERLGLDIAKAGDLASTRAASERQFAAAASAASAAVIAAA
jgi:hypothetical protein